MYQWTKGWRKSDAYVDATLENAAIGIAHVGLDGAWLRVNERLLELVGYERGELLTITFQDITHPDDLETDLGLLRDLIDGKIPHYQMEKRYFRKDGELIWVNLTVGMQRTPEGKPDFCISLIEDITNRKADEDHLKILIDELNHRVKNTLATVQAVAHMSFRKDEPIAEAKRAFTDRLQVLSSAHDILTNEKWTGADFRQVVRGALRPFNLDTSDRMSLEGGNVRLESRQALTLAMAINELTTNAVKYGSLSVEQGSVALQWQRTRGTDGAKLKFEWIESGGPPCKAVERSGFGSMLLTKILAGDFHGEATLDYLDTGLKYTLLAQWPGEAG